MDNQVREHSSYNEKCPFNDQGFLENPRGGVACTCHQDGFLDPNEVGNLSGQELLDALTEAWKNRHYKGWTYNDMLHGPSVLPIAVYDPSDKIVKHEAVIAIRMSDGAVAEMTLMVTTPNGTTYQDFVPKGPPTDTP